MEKLIKLEVWLKIQEWVVEGEKTYSQDDVGQEKR
jgi:hypothetical protein